MSDQDEFNAWNGCNRFKFKTLYINKKKKIKKIDKLGLLRIKKKKNRKKRNNYIKLILHIIT